MFVACTHCGSWFRAAEPKDQKMVTCVYCHRKTPIRNRWNSPSIGEARGSDLSELGALLPLKKGEFDEQARRELISSQPTKPGVPSVEVDLVEELLEEDQPTTPRAMAVASPAWPWPIPAGNERSAPLPKRSLPPPLPPKAVHRSPPTLPPPASLVPIAMSTTGRPSSIQSVRPSREPSWTRRTNWRSRAVFIAAAAVTFVAVDLAVPLLWHAKLTSPLWSPPVSGYAAPAPTPVPRVPTTVAARPEGDAVKNQDAPDALSVPAVVVPALAAPAPRPTEGIEGSDLRALLHNADAARRSGDTATASSLYTAILARDPSNSEALGAEGDIALASGKVDDAQRAYGRALTANPGYLPAWLGVAETEWRQGDTIAARRTYHDILARFPASLLPARVKERADESSSVDIGAPFDRSAQL